MQLFTSAEGDTCTGNCPLVVSLNPLQTLIITVKSNKICMHQQAITCNCAQLISNLEHRNSPPGTEGQLQQKQQWILANLGCRGLEDCSASETGAACSARRSVLEEVDEEATAAACVCWPPGRLLKFDHE